MASRQFTSKARRGRNRSPSPRRTRSTRPTRKRGVAQPEPDAARPLRQAIENERGELLRAKAVLGCLHSALLDLGRDEDPTSYADVVEVVCRLVGDAFNRLDSVYIGPLLDRLGGAGRWQQRDRKTGASMRRRSP